jgi:hypothetical protein
MNEQLLKDFIATAQKYNYDWNTTFSKFPELKDYDQQLLKDYVATAENENYNYSVVNSKFPELGFQAQEELKKKDEFVSTELPSEESPLVSSSRPKTDFEIATAKAQGKYIAPTGTLQEQVKAAGQAAMGDSYMGATIPYKMTDAFKKSEEKQAQQLFDEQTKSKQDFNESLSQVNQELASNDEEDAVPRLKYLFGNYGFEFDETGAGDAVEVKAPNGKKKTISIDMFTDKSDILAANELRDFINQNKPVIENETSAIKKYKTEEEVDLVTKRINDSNQQLNNSLNSLKAEMDAFNIEKENLKKNANAPDFFEKAIALDQKAADIIRRNEELSAKSAEININQNEIQRLAGYYTKAKAEEGGIFRASYNAALKSIGGVGAGLFDFLLKVSPLSAGADPYREEAKEAAKVIRESLVNVAGAEVSKEYMEAAQEDFLKRNVIGAAGFVPILAAAAAQPQLAGTLFFSSAYDAANEEMDSNPAFEKLSSTEKTAVATTLGLVNAALLKYNATNTFLKTEAGKKFVASVLQKMGSETSAKTVQEFVENEVKNGLSKGVITAVSGGAHGFTTGMELITGELGVKTAYNLMKDEKMFEVPTEPTKEGEEKKGFDINDINAKGYAKQIVEGGIDMAMGAVFLGSIKTISTARKENNFKGVTDNDVAMFEAFAADNNLRTLNVQNIKSELLKKNYDEYRSKGMTSSEAYENAKKDVQDLNDAVSIFNSMPSDLSLAGKRKAFGLLTERTLLEQKIEGKEKSLVKKETDRIAEINKDLEDLSTAQKNRKDAIQEQTAGEVPVQPTAGVGETVETGKPEAEPEVTTKEGEAKAEEVKPAEATPISDAEYNDFIDKGTVSEERLNDIANKVKNRESLSDRETEIFSDKTNEINKIIEKSTEVKPIEAKAEEVKPTEAKTEEVKATEETVPVEKEKVFTFDKDGNIVKAEVLSKGKGTLSILVDGKQAVRVNSEVFTSREEAQKRIETKQAEQEAIDAFKMTDRYRDQEYIRLSDEMSAAQQRIGRADDADAAIEEYNAAKKALQDFEAETEQIKDKKRAKSNLNDLIELEKSSYEENPRYPYKELFNKDPRLASLQSAKDMLEFAKSGDLEKAYVEMGMAEQKAKVDVKKTIEKSQRDIADLEADLASNPVASSKAKEIPAPVAEAKKKRKVAEKGTAKKSKASETAPTKAKKVKPTEAKVGATPKVDELLNLDTKDKTNLEKVFDFLDNADKDLSKRLRGGANEGMLAIPLGTMQVIVKAIKVLVKGGMTLQEAITKAAKDNKVSFDDVVKGMKGLADEINELKIIKQTIKEIRLAKKNIKDKRKLITDVIDGIKKSGKLSAKQANALLKKANNLNVENFEQLNKFVDYAEKVFADAEYADKLSTANGLKKSIKNVAKSDKYNPSLVKLAKRFVRIDPSLVEDIDAYNKMAEDIKEAVKGSSMKKFAETVEIKAADAYVEEMLTAQKEKLTEMMREQVQELLGVDGSTLTYDEMMDMLETKKEDMSAQNEKIVRSAAIKLFESYSSIIESIFNTGKDPFTGEDVDVKASKKEVVKKFMDMDLRKMDIKDAIRAVDALKNFVVNESTAKMEDVVRKYIGNEKATKLDKLNIRSKRLKIYFNKRAGRFIADQFATQPVLFEALFGGQRAAEFVEREMGVTDLKSNKSKAQSMVNKMVADYTAKFSKTKPNGQDFNTTFNNVERGMLSFVSRTKIGDEQTSFNNRKKLVGDSIEKLKTGTEEQQKKAEVYQEVYDKILKDSKNAQEVKSKTNKTNADAVDFWVEKWAENYDELADVSENIHNAILGKDAFYTPDKFSTLGPERGIKVEKEGDFDIMGSAFIQNSGNVYKTKTGRLEEATTKNELPSNRYVDLSFDSNNANLMMDAMIDIKTAGDVRQVDAFMKSDAFQKIVPNAEERKILQTRIDLMVRNFRNKNHYNYDEIAKLSKSLNRIAALGASYALGGVGQPFKQVIPVAINTMANGGIPKFNILFDKSKRDFINNSGEAIAMRGAESVSEFKTVDALLDKAAESTPEKAMQLIEKASGMYLKIFLQKPDAYIAKASWLTYYEKSLKRQGKKTDNIDYNKHELNKEAAQYATRMVDRQQNISDADLKGKVFSNKDGVSQIVTKVVLPFASFRINQWLRMNNDLGVLTSKTATKEDKKAAARSLSGFGVEVAAFNAIGYGLSVLTYGVATSILRNATGSDIDEEEEKKLQEKDEKYLQNLRKGKASSVIQDVFSPVPMLDPFFESAIYSALDAVQSLQDIEEKDRVNIFAPKFQTEVLKGLGTLGIAAERTAKLIEIGSALATGKVKEESYGKTSVKNIRSRDEEVLAPLTTLALLNSLGLLPTEFNSVQNTIFKEITKQASTKTEEEIVADKEKKKTTKEKNLQKIDEIEEAMSKTKNQDVLSELEKMKKKIEEDIEKPELTETEEEMIAEKKEMEKEEYKKLLGKYDNRSDLKRRDPDLYEKNFGEGSQYYKDKKEEMKAKELLKDVKEKNKDERYGDTVTSTSKSRNRDGSRRRKFQRTTRYKSRFSKRT